MVEGKKREKEGRRFQVVREQTTWADKSKKMIFFSDRRFAPERFKKERDEVREDSRPSAPFVREPQLVKAAGVISGPSTVTRKAESPQSRSAPEAMVSTGEGVGRSPFAAFSHAAGESPQLEGC